MIVTRYGVHWASGGVPFLVQSSGAQNLISPSLESPFVINVRPRRLQCPHNIDLSVTAKAEWAQDPLAQAFLPVPKTPGEKARIIHDPASKLDALLVQLTRLCSPVDVMLKPIWWRQPQLETPQYGLTDTTPMVLIGASLDTIRSVFAHLELGKAYNRRVVFVSRDRLPLPSEIEWITTDLTDVSAEPLEAIGAGALKEYMQNGHHG